MVRMDVARIHCAFSCCRALVVVALASTATAASGTGFHDWSLSGVLDPVGMSTFAENGLDRFTAAANDSTTPAFYVSALPLVSPLPIDGGTQRSAYSVASAIIGVQSLCVATANATLSRSFSLLDLARHVTGANPIPNIRVAVVGKASSVNDILIRGFAREGAVSGFSLGSATTSTSFSSSSVLSFPTSVVNSTGVVILASDNDVAAWLTVGGDASVVRIGFMPLLEASRRKLKCYTLAVPHPKTGTPTEVSPRLDLRWAPLARVDGLTVSMPSVTTAAYPLIGAIVFNVRTDIACSGGPESRGGLYAWEAYATTLFDSADVSTRLQQWGALQTEQFLGDRTMAALIQAVGCFGARRVTGSGSSATQHALASLASMYHHSGSNVLVFYSGGGSGEGLSALKAGRVVWSVTDTLFTTQERASHPSITFVPFAAFSIVITYNTPDTLALVIPRCALVPIFNGSLQYWDDPRLQNANPGIVFPHKPITVIVLSGRSGTVSGFTAGLSRLDAECHGGDTAYNSSILQERRFRASDVWNVSFPALLQAKGIKEVVTTLANTSWSVTFMAQDAARLESLPEASIVDVRTNAFTVPSREGTTNALSRTVASSGGEPVLDLGIADYPFMSMAYFAVDSKIELVAATDEYGVLTCENAKAAVDFILWVVNSADANPALFSHYFAHIPYAVNVASSAKLRAAICNGRPLFPEFAKSSGGLNSTSVVLIALLVPLAVVLAVVACFRALCGWTTARDVSCAPMDDSKEVSIVFTDIQSSTALWAELPQEMGCALDKHHEIIRQIISSHKAYEVKTIGDSFMIACGSAEQAVKISLDIQSALYENDWGTVAFDRNYCALIREAANSGVSSVKIGDPALWNGLRVRVGIATGPCDIKFDEVTKGYDYYGTTVNTAARVESVAHGGQIVVTEATLKALPDALRLDLVDHDFGPQMLRGLDHAVGLHQVSSERFACRWFPPLRLDEVDEGGDQETQEDDRETTTNDDEDHHHGLAPVASESLEKSQRANNDDVRSPTGGGGLKGLTRVMTGVRSSFDEKRDQITRELGHVVTVFLSTMPLDDRNRSIAVMCKAWRVTPGRKTPPSLVRSHAPPPRLDPVREGGGAAGDMDGSVVVPPLRNDDGIREDDDDESKSTTDVAVQLWPVCHRVASILATERFGKRRSTVMADGMGSGGHRRDPRRPEASSSRGAAGARNSVTFDSMSTTSLVWGQREQWGWGDWGTAAFGRGGCKRNPAGPDDVGAESIRWGSRQGGGV